MSIVIVCDSCKLIGMGIDHKSGGAAKARTILRREGWRTGLRGGVDKCKECADREMKAQSEREAKP